MLEKVVGMPFGNQDVYLNIVGGIKINEPALDLGIVLASASSYKNVSIPLDTIAIGEVGLTGEVRSVNMIEKRIKEAEKLLKKYRAKVVDIIEYQLKTDEDVFERNLVVIKNV